MGFSGLDEFSLRAVETLIGSPLTYRFASDAFSSQHLLSPYQTLVVFKREIPTDNVDGSDPNRYQNIRFSKVIDAFGQLNVWLEDEARRLFGEEEWRQRVRLAPNPEQRMRDLAESGGEPVAGVRVDDASVAPHRALR